jgi:Protein of unknown function (DUF2505)
VPRSFEVLVESPTSVEQVHAAFGREDYWLARFSAFGATSTLDSLTVGADGTVRVAVTQDLRHDVLPGIVAKFYRRDLKIRHRETWRSVGDGRVRGEISVAVSGAPGSGSGAAVVAPAQHGSRLTFTANVEFKVPLVGGTIENFIAREFAQGIPEIQRFTATWISENG